MVRIRFGGIICQPRWGDNGAGGIKGSRADGEKHFFAAGASRGHSARPQPRIELGTARSRSWYARASRGHSARLQLARQQVLRADTQHARSTATSWEQIVVGTFLHALRADIQHACSWRNSRRALRADSVRSAVDGWLRACCLMFKNLGIFLNL